MNAKSLGIKFGPPRIIFFINKNDQTIRTAETVAKHAATHDELCQSERED